MLPAVARLRLTLRVQVAQLSGLHLDPLEIGVEVHTLDADHPSDPIAGDVAGVEDRVDRSEGNAELLRQRRDTSQLPPVDLVMGRDRRTSDAAGLIGSGRW